MSSHTDYPRIAKFLRVAPLSKMSARIDPWNKFLERSLMMENLYQMGKRASTFAVAIFFKVRARIF